MQIIEYRTISDMPTEYTYGLDTWVGDVDGYYFSVHPEQEVFYRLPIAGEVEQLATRVMKKVAHAESELPLIAIPNGYMLLVRVTKVRNGKTSRRLVEAARPGRKGGRCD